MPKSLTWCCSANALERDEEDDECVEHIVSFFCPCWSVSRRFFLEFFFETFEKMTTAAKEEEEENADLKIILLGDSAVGKSKLVERFLLEDFVPRQLSTYALTLYRHKAEIEDKEINVDFWDTVRFTYI